MVFKIYWKNTKDLDKYTFNITFLTLLPLFFSKFKILQKTGYASII